MEPIGVRVTISTVCAFNHQSWLIISGLECLKVITLNWFGVSSMLIWCDWNMQMIVWVNYQALQVIILRLRLDWVQQFTVKFLHETRWFKTKLDGRVAEPLDFSNQFQFNCNQFIGTAIDDHSIDLCGVFLVTLNPTSSPKSGLTHKLCHCFHFFFQSFFSAFNGKIPFRNDKKNKGNQSNKRTLI